MTFINLAVQICFPILLFRLCDTNNNSFTPFVDVSRSETLAVFDFITYIPGERFIVAIIEDYRGERETDRQTEIEKNRISTDSFNGRERKQKRGTPNRNRDRQ